MGKSILTMSAAQRLKAQEKQSKRFDRAVNKKFKAMKKAWKKKIAGKVFKGAAFVAIAAAAGAVIGKAKEVAKTKSGDELREMASKIKVKFDEKKEAVKKQVQQASMKLKKDSTVAQDSAEMAKEDEILQDVANVTQEGAEWQEDVENQGTGQSGESTMAAEKAAEEINRNAE